MLHLYRICSREFSPWDTTGAIRYPGRWHDLGQPALYFSSSLALAVLEMRANGIDFGALRTSYHYSAVEIADEGDGIDTVPAPFFKGDWSASKDASRALGSDWLKKGRKLLLGVKSAALAAEWNYVANGSHADFKRLRFARPQHLPLDARL